MYWPLPYHHHTQHNEYGQGRLFFYKGLWTPHCREDRIPLNHSHVGRSKKTPYQGATMAQGTLGERPPSMAKPVQLVSTYGLPTHVDLVAEETYSNGLAAFLATMWSDFHPLIADLIRYNIQERRSRVYWESE